MINTVLKRISDAAVLEILLHQVSVVALSELGDAITRGTFTEVRARQLEAIDKMRAEVAADADLERERLYHEGNIDEVRRRLGAEPDADDADEHDGSR